MTARTGRRLPMLVYHKIDEPESSPRFPRNCVRPDQFRAQLALLRRLGFQSVTLDDYLAARDGRTPLPRRAIVITFDDGYRNFREVAHPLLCRYGFGATVFVVTGAIGGTNRWDADERQVPLLDRTEIRELATGGIEFQSHTVTHPHLPALTEASARAELSESRQALTELLGRPVRAICYPYADHDPRTEALAREVGYEVGVTIRRRLNRPETNAMALRRIPVTYETSLARFAWDLARLRLHGD